MSSPRQNPPAEHHRCYGMKFDFKLGDDSEVATASAQGPEQVSVFFRVRAHIEPSADQSETFNVVAGEPVQAGEPAKSAAEDQPGGARMRDYA